MTFTREIPVEISRPDARLENIMCHFKADTATTIILTADGIILLQFYLFIQLKNGRYLFSYSLLQTGLPLL